MRWDTAAITAEVIVQFGMARREYGTHGKKP
jgi:hypothetical protein